MTQPHKLSGVIVRTISLKEGSEEENHHNNPPNHPTNHPTNQCACIAMCCGWLVQGPELAPLAPLAPFQHMKVRVCAVRMRIGSC